MKRLLLAALAAFMLSVGLVPSAAQAATIEPPVISASGAEITWPLVPGADSYNVDFDGGYFTTVDGPPYIAPTSGSYSVVAVDKDTTPLTFSARSNVVQVTVTTTPPGPDYTTIFSDDFEGTELTDKFYVPDWTSGNRFAVNNVDACSQAGGSVNLSVKKVGDEHHACYLISKDTFGPGDNTTLKIQYTANLTELRAKGSWAAGWMYPLGTDADGTDYAADGDASTGSEYDVFEYSPAWATAFNSAVHDGRPEQSQQWTDNKGIETGTHTWTLEWNKECQVYSVDDTPVWKITDPALISQADNHHIMLTMEAVTGRDLLTWQEIGDFAQNLTQFPATAKFESVSVQQKTSIDGDLCGDPSIPTPVSTKTPEPSPDPSATSTETASPNPSVTVTETAEPTSQPTVTVTATPTATATVTAAPEVDVYSTPGYHRVNGRIWFTACEPYSQTTRCSTDIWSTQVKYKGGGKFSSVTGWHFNNLTYLPRMARAQWGNNPLAVAGTFESAGRLWKTECDTEITGRNGCRSYVWAKNAVESQTTAAGYSHSLTDKWVFNNIVRFS